ncbi:thioredoxin fold domain-containing protein [Photobacterium leiognathi]|uniref:thioredoxin fold domain-containing protein n=1 Tax=Photobacterium leiognathi TaxID=553611 RepID=UPI002980FF13|nr:thioredoxin fold domain-containing protein [Photobacterium leiognathi]
MDSIIVNDVKNKIGGDVAVAYSHEKLPFHVLEFGENKYPLVVDTSGRYVIDGKIIDAETGVEFLEGYKTQKYYEVIERMNDSEFITYASVGEKKSTLYVMSDPSCPYCKKFHQEISDLNKNGVEVKIILFNRNNTGTPSGLLDTKIANILNSEDKNNVLDSVMNGDQIELKHLDKFDSLDLKQLNTNFNNAIDARMTGTPFSLLVPLDGANKLIEGYVPAKSILLL